MKSLDHNYLLLQFKNKIFYKNGTEFQSFFEEVMEAAFSDFQKIRPYGNMGDGGNDGFRRDAGIYYQIYSPITPKIKESEAATKLYDDFEKLKKEWCDFSNIREYHFVFNDKYGGSVQLLEEKLAILKKENPEVKFKLLLSKSFERVFFKLNETIFLNLGFNVDSREAISNTYNYLEKVQTELDKDNSEFAKKLLKNVKDIVQNHNDESLTCEYKILQCKCLKNIEKVDEAREEYEKIIIEFPQDPRAYLFLAEIYHSSGSISKHNVLIEQARRIDGDFWFLTFSQMISDFHSAKEIDVDAIINSTSDESPKIKAIFYHALSWVLEAQDEPETADAFIEKAIRLNPNNIRNHISKLLLHHNRFLNDKNSVPQELLDRALDIEENFPYMGNRNKALLNTIKLTVYFAEKDFYSFEETVKANYDAYTKCYFDSQLDQIIISSLQHISMPLNDLKGLLDLIMDSGSEVSDFLSRMLVIQFNYHENLLTLGKKFFTDIKKNQYVTLINELEKDDYSKVLDMLSEDPHFMMIFASTLKGYPELREKIIRSLPTGLEKDKLLINFYYSEENYDEAFEILSGIDLSGLSFLECRPILDLIRKKEAWDSEEIILKKLLNEEKDFDQVFDLNLQLFNTYIHLKNYREILELGKEILEEGTSKNIKNKVTNWEGLLINTIQASMERGKVDDTYIKNALELIQKYPLDQPSFFFKAGTEAEVYIENKKYSEALKSIIDAVKVKKILTPEEYSTLYFVLAIKIGENAKITLDTLSVVENNTFVKLKNIDRWFFIGDGNELDTVKITTDDEKYSLFLNAKVSQNISFISAYQSSGTEEEIEKIYSIEQYVLSQVVHHFHSLSRDGLMSGVWSIEMPEEGDSINIENLQKFLEDSEKPGRPLFDLYCKNPVPFAMLATNEGSIERAIGRIQQEKKGFIQISSGNPDEFEKQIKAAKLVIENQTPFYMDALSALFLSESGTLKTVHTHLPNIKTPQSVINFLIRILEKSSYKTSTVGHMGYFDGKISITKIEAEDYKKVNSNFQKSIQLLESNPELVSVISFANKDGGFFESEILEELVDACVLAKKEKIPILSDDYHYLQMNAHETKSTIPEYFSSLALLRALYELGKISFDDYLDYYAYLTNYRCRFMTFSFEDIEKSIFGDGEVNTINISNIRKLNFPITLSEEYGVEFQIAIGVVGRLLVRTLTDVSILPEILERLFIEIIEGFPTNLSKKEFSRLMLMLCSDAVKPKGTDLIISPYNNSIQAKLDKLKQVTEIYN